MIYKPGQKVKIKKDVSPPYKDKAIDALKKNSYILTIKGKRPCADKHTFYYDMEEETGYRWHEKFIEGIYEEPILDPINSRFDILDL